MLRRKIYDKLIKWKGKNGKHALLIEGARGVGKTTLIEEFARTEYRSYVRIDFSKPCDAVKDLFERYSRNWDTFFMRLSALLDVQLYPRESLIFFDEVQEYPRARAAIKHLVKDGRYDYIESGSLISIKKNVENILIPSEEDFIRMYPLDFEEFCWAMGEDVLADYVKEAFEKKIPMGEVVHGRVMEVFCEYLLVGGMPQCVQDYVDSKKNLVAVDEIKHKILSLYDEDISKINPSGKSKAQNIYKMLPTFLSAKNKRIVYRQVCDGMSANDFYDALYWLGDSMICNISRGLENPDLGLPVRQDRNAVKCYMGDTGLLSEFVYGDDAASKRELYVKTLDGDLSACNSMLYENAVAQMLTSAGYRLNYYSRYDVGRHKSDIDVDFLIRDKRYFEGKAIPIVLKVGTTYSIKALERFRQDYESIMTYSIVIYPGDLKVDGDLIYLPPYMIFCL